MAALDKSILAKMNRSCMIINHGGEWNGSDYIGGDEELLLIPSGGISRAALIEEIHHILNHNQKQCDCLLFCVIELSQTRKVKLRIKNDVDLSYMFATFQNPLLYVISKPNPKETRSSPTLNVTWE
ncbi:uncharacterized protein LOC121804025 [Salvia splendens]|uniref:uncharacterized protein LOC121804025 n=1 Tax=Salvia splendens TaxID=180675 RepID=UPI001C27DF4F|nr:uncharacterized protein LOC121804025 [Salvia splendens]